MATSSTNVSISTAAPSSSAIGTPMPTPLTVTLRSHIAGTADFVPFSDLATLRLREDDPFSFKELIEEGIDGDQNIVLVRSGCSVGDGRHDCGAACADPATLFGSLETFYNCAALASVAYWTTVRGDYFVDAEAERNASVLMGNGTLAGFDGQPVLDTFVECALASCAGDGLGTPCDGAVLGLSDSSTDEEVFAAMETFCPDIAAEINPDIFGPGVIISYFLQVCFSGMLYAFLKGFTIWVRLTQKPKPAPAPMNRRLNRIESMLWPDSSALSRTSIAVATTLVEFQEAQSWFVFALQLASILAIVVNSQEGAFWGEIVVNSALAYHVSLNGVLPMFLIQVCLHNEGIRNWHTFLGFLVEYLLAVVAATQTVKFKDAFELFKSQNSIKQCGYNPSPRTYCAARRHVPGFELRFFPHPLLYKIVFLGLDTLTIIVLVADQLAWTLRNHYRTKHIRVRGHQVGRWPKGFLHPQWVRFKTWFWRCLELAYVIVNILYMVSLLEVVDSSSFAANRWSYGQIIAMTVWGPVIVKLFDILLSGPPKNGERLNTGPPRLRIDNVINRRHGTSADEELEETEEMLDDVPSEEPATSNKIVAVDDARQDTRRDKKIR